VLASALADELHQQVVVDDRPGGALTVGLDLAAKSPADGYTLCMGPIGALAITRHLVVPLPYDVARDFQPIALVARGQLLLAVSPATAFHSVPELISPAINDLMAGRVQLMFESLNSVPSGCFQSMLLRMLLLFCQIARRK
jgi:tripartite-type tricarboxylate transporter receptor subunit TctC